MFVITLCTFSVTVMFTFFWNCRNFVHLLFPKEKQQLPGKKVSNVLIPHPGFSWPYFHTILVKFSFCFSHCVITSCIPLYSINFLLHRVDWFQSGANELSAMLCDKIIKFEKVQKMCIEIKKFDLEAGKVFWPQPCT